MRARRSNGSFVARSTRGAGHENLERAYFCRNRGCPGHFAKHSCVALSLCAGGIKEKLTTAMNDFSELENELKKLRPVQPSSSLLSRVEEAMADDSNIADEKII